MSEPFPLFPDEKMIAIAVLGAARAKEWPAKARQMENEGLPLIDELMGARYWPAVVGFFNERHGVGAGPLRPSISNGIRVVPYAPDGKENFDAAPRRRRRPTT